MNLYPLKEDMTDIRLRSFTSGDRDFFAELGQDERVVRFIGSGSPCTTQRIDQRVDLALSGSPTTENRSSRWFIADQPGINSAQPIGLFVSARNGDAVEMGLSEERCVRVRPDPRGDGRG